MDGTSASIRRGIPFEIPAQGPCRGSAGVLKAFAQGADMVFIACNTASTQYERIRHAVDQAYPGQSRPVVSIIDASTDEARRLLDLSLSRKASATFAILATPATVRSMVYPRQLASRYGAPITEEAPRPHTQPRWYKTGSATVAVSPPR
ncbi:MAG: aspartate/glutamate racemase family protein [Geothrix sp.]|nr:aspartate/glutamate racemase family protein [Geothrix sp.]